jgi:class 3 adenylate cyclase
LHTDGYFNTLRYVSTAGQRQSFLFTDLVGFTALAASEGDDRAAEVALEFYAVVRGLLGEHCAEEVKAIGDALMLRCEDPELAVRLGLAIVESLDATPGFPPVRVGVHTGPAVAREGDWYGTTVNVAARLCAAAAGGEVLVSEETTRAAGRVRHIRFGERRLHWLKNVTEPVAAHSADARPSPGARLRELRARKRRVRARRNGMHLRPEEASM